MPDTEYAIPVQLTPAHQPRDLAGDVVIGEVVARTAYREGGYTEVRSVDPAGPGHPRWYRLIDWGVFGKGADEHLEPMVDSLYRSAESAGREYRATVADLAESGVHAIEAGSVVEASMLTV